MAILSFYAEGGNGGGGAGVRVITCDARIEFTPNDDYTEYKAELYDDAELQNEIYTKIFGHEYIASADNVAEDVKNLSAPVWIKLTNVWTKNDGAFARYELSPLPLSCSVSASEWNNESSLVAHVWDYYQTWILHIVDF